MTQNKPKIDFDFSDKDHKESSPVEPSHNKFVTCAEKIMIIVGVCGQSLFYFQAYKIYAMGSASDVSGWGFSFAFLSLVCWLIYGIIIHNKVLILVNAFAVIGAFLTLLAIFLVS